MVKERGFCPERNICSSLQLVVVGTVGVELRHFAMLPRRPAGSSEFLAAPQLRAAPAL